MQLDQQYPSWQKFRQYWESQGLRNVVIEGVIGGIIGGVILGLLIGILLWVCLRQGSNDQNNKDHQYPIQKRQILINENSPTKSQPQQNKH